MHSSWLLIRSSAPKPAMQLIPPGTTNKLTPRPLDDTPYRYQKAKGQAPWISPAAGNLGIAVASRGGAGEAGGTRRIWGISIAFMWKPGGVARAGLEQGKVGLGTSCKHNYGWAADRHGNTGSCAMRVRCRSIEPCFFCSSLFISQVPACLGFGCVMWSRERLGQYIRSR